MLVHICCSVDSHYFISELKKVYPDEKIIAYFYDPNIHPLSEYELRFLDVKRSCDKLGIKLYKGEYEYEKWLQSVKGYENEPEKGKRCSICFDVRMGSSVEFAVKLGEKKLTTTLLTSPKKDLEQLRKTLQKECEPYGIEFLAPDFRKNGGTQRQFALAKQAMLYHQNYCGCIYGLNKQKQDKSFIDEFISPINKQILPASIQARIALYKKAYLFEKKGLKFKIIRQKFLNYRLLSALIKIDKKPVKSHILFYSHFKNSYTRFSLDEHNLKQNVKEGFYRSTKDEILFVEFWRFNQFFKNKWKNFEDFLKHPLSIEVEIKWRVKHFGFYDLSPVVILENILPTRYEIIAKSEIYNDSKEILIKI
ncbi:epoxyqueuosine reductase QueH [Campylobacter hepaticus]|uniref:Epoxyqueuosine reductase QueH n=1 Tax=Campylobacter hepaticus TaxID=1813019 RepID=A0A6A7JQC8_9BACT|nr:epoxyqueuosine reductase QueH [Campylobacter hepaticus]AXP09386.1 diacylglucosamine hydrolase like protein [Campylobacter hepaticus]MCZ0772872.1 epoxyqueuosine reductase QueH [Campylobacter hepaticus]MCZ0774341.1 epoxyqueuosine reductase QueH [Campylobacter hepaticus]MCZ0775593.1 epoxyqueuosine reductase QueH [Campylobacter hepaticus]MDX2323124.1 epoxyqueuosine reductase QueH [Campylobacter hepaticus]